MSSINSAIREYKDARKCLQAIRKISVTTARKQTLKLYLENLVKRLVFKANVKLRDAIEKSQK
jgi:hypothetical protein